MLSAAVDGSDSNMVTTQDRVYLLSLEELEWFEDAGMNTLAVPTDAAIEQDGSGWYGVYSLDYGVKEYDWWLREPVDGSSSQCYMVGNGYTENNLFEFSVGLEGFGIRPAITVDLWSEAIIK